MSTAAPWHNAGAALVPPRGTSCIFTRLIGHYGFQGAQIAQFTKWAASLVQWVIYPSIRTDPPPFFAFSSLFCPSP